MQIINSLDGLRISEKTSVALGNFDGIHLGHQDIMQSAAGAAKEKGLSSLCFTFSNHPFNYILGRDASDPAAVKLICSEAEKISLIAGMGFDILVNVPFDDSIMKMRARGFFEDVLIGKLNAGCICAGFNYSYGARAEGTPAMLREECASAGIDCIIRDAVTLGGRVVSSTLIRETIASGDMELVKSYLGRPLSFAGRVEHGNRIGSANGCPTANIVPEADRKLPPDGVYFSRTLIGGREYKSVSNLGVKPTIEADGGQRSIETNIFDFDGDLYGRDIAVSFEHFSRTESRFATKEELFDQIRRDCDEARRYDYIQQSEKHECDM